ncbi:MAG: saccharopine dehydrogenase NADP-binding domain-containing protein, partial [Bacillota bacterium]
MMKFDGKILVIGLGAVSRCTLPLLFKHISMDRKRITVMDFAEVGDAAKEVIAAGAKFVQAKVTQENLGKLLGQYVGVGDIIIDLAWNIGCNDILQWCHDHGVRYVNASVEMWDPYAGAADKTPVQRTLYWRHMQMREMLAKWGRKGPTAVLDHGANPGLVQHFTKEALDDMGKKWLEDHKAHSQRRDLIQDALKSRAYNRLAMELGVKTIHISERDTQISNQPKEVDEFVNTWSVEGFREEGIAPAEMGWGTHERLLPPRAWFHQEGPMNQICLAQMGCRTWVRSWVPNYEIVGMVIR